MFKTFNKFRIKRKRNGFVQITCHRDQLEGYFFGFDRRLVPDSFRQDAIALDAGIVTFLDALYE